MKHLAGPKQKYTLGAFPSHSSLESVHMNFKAMDELALRFIMQKQGWLNESGKPTKKAANDELIDVIEKKYYWNLTKLQQALEANGDNVERAAVNQEIKTPSTGEPRWVNLGTLGTYFSVSANTVGKWLDVLGLRDDDKMASQEAMELGLATTFEMSTGEGKNKTRKINHWNLYLTQEKLIEAGHYLDFDYEASLKGKGKNSDVTVLTVDDRAKDFAQKFVKMYRNPLEHARIPSLVKNQPKIVLEKAETILKRPGFITEGKYLKNIKR